MKPQHLQNYYGGSFQDPIDGTYLDNLAPASHELIAKIPRSNQQDVDAAVNAAHQALNEGGALKTGWARSSMAERADLCEAVADGIEARLDELATLESNDTGKPIWLARTVDIPRAVANFRFFAGAIRHDETGFHAMDNAINYTLRRPLGVCALITPWNLPLYLLTWKSAPALAMGNVIVAKPSELTPMTANALAEIFHEVGAPSGVFNLVHGTGPECGEPLVTHEHVAGVSFTGGTQTGARVAALAAPRFKKHSLELGGKNATLVFDDCDFERALEGSLRAGYLNQGQVCLCGSRLLVQRGIYDRFVEQFLDRVRLMHAGDPANPDHKLGALVSQAHRDKVESYLKLAKEEGGRIVGGDRPQLPAPFDQGAFLNPAAVTNLPIDCRTAQEEIFGPVVTIHPFDHTEEALQMANGVRYGLSASVWTRDLDRAHFVSARIDTGMVWVNTWLLRDLRVPFGGMKESGVGREGGRYSLEFFSESRNVCIQLGKPT